MPAEYYPETVIIMTDELFDSLLPPLTFESTPAQRQFAFKMAEQFVVDAINAPLNPVAITGTYSWPHPNNRMMLDHVYIRSVDRVVIKTRTSGYNCDLTDNSGCAVLLNHYGYIDVVQTQGAYITSCGRIQHPAYLEVTYTAGLATGTAANDTRLQMAIAMLARQQLLETTDPGSLEGGAGDPGVASYGTQGYNETRTQSSVRHTAFGNSAITTRAADLIEHLRIRRPLKF